ncbi:GNAT family N-acetyltransferase [Actinospica durhamensis]|uniref:GNAT family N-acetyltransferase n=1 Tax=Actinospica durhamensis TaxID=1508375 RepID=A0A941IPS0_9ACTN|nr:GNAT family N-acetyltransferase [Actinospica durhamensis]MBR7836850.1 GNAT family N-acetyltransferase [Actinospica durhamensis]
MPRPLETHPEPRIRAEGSSEPLLTSLTRFAQFATLEAEWRALADEAAPLNPYASPDWTLTWLRHTVAEPELALLTVRRGERLIGLAPFYLRDLGHLARTVQLAGTGRLGALTELPQVLAAPGETRRVLRAVVGHWLARSDEWDWLELPLTVDQGWFEPQWLGESKAVSGLVQHKTTRAAVVLPLVRPDGSDHHDHDDHAGHPLRPFIKRNVWESVKRARHRLDRSGEPWDITIHAGPAAVRAVLPDLRRLHTARARMAGARVHPDTLADPSRRAFFADAVHRMATSGRAEVLTLDVAGTPVAAALVLRARSASYLALTGLDPDWWAVGPVTLLQYTAMERALERGDTEANLSVGPDVSKLRWSEHVVQHPEFVVCGPRTRSRVLLSGYAAAAAVAAVRREAARHQVRERGAGERSGAPAPDGGHA